MITERLFPYRVRIIRIANGYQATAVALPGCDVSAPTYGEALIRIKNRIEHRLESLADDGKSFPSDDGEYSDVVIVADPLLPPDNVGPDDNWSVGRSRGRSIATSVTTSND